MKVQTKFISADTEEDLERLINQFLKNTKGNLIEIRPVAYTTDSGYFKEENIPNPIEGWTYATKFAVIISYKPASKPLWNKNIYHFKGLREKFNKLKEKINNKDKVQQNRKSKSA